jgi:DNA invertase Pin-like site-specific DNA recombinase
MYYIYKRISTEKQSLLRQDNEIAEYCKENNIDVPQENQYSDVITGKTINRENYQKMKSKLVKGDILIILDIDRLGRKWDIIKSEWQELTQRGVYIIVVNCPLINVLPDKDGQVSVDKRLIQEMMFTLLCYVSQKEVEKVSERTKSALKAKKEQGIRLGKKVDYTKADEERAIELRKKGWTLQKIAEETGISKSAVHRLCNG